MGYLDGGQDVREFSGGPAWITKFSPGAHFSCARRCPAPVYQTDPAGNSKLAKGGSGRRLRCRDDAAAALILAIAEGQRRAAAKASKPAFSYAIV